MDQERGVGVRVLGLPRLALLFLCPGMGLAQEEFPIGAWFPGLFNDQSERFAERLDQVEAAHFNTIHSAIEVRNDAAVNRVFMDLAHERGLRVQLYSWNVPPGWRAASRRYWTKSLEATSPRYFVHPVGERAGGAWFANTGEHTPGLMLDTPSEGRGIFLRYREQKLNSRGQIVAPRARYVVHVFRMKTDDNAGADIVATLRILRHSDGAVLRTRSVRKLQFHAADTYQDFVLRYVPAANTYVRYQVEWTGAANLWVDQIRAHDDYSHRLFAGHHDEAIRSDLAAYDGVSAPEPWRFYADDEPQWTEKDESVAYVNRFIREQTGKSGVVAFNRPQRDLLRHFVGTVEPSELLVDFYTFGLNVPSPGQSGYAAGLQGALSSLVSWYGTAREVVREAGIPLWVLVQAHSWPGGLRDPSPQEIRVQVHLALAHGARGIYYFMYSSHTNDDGRPDLQGLVDPHYRITPKWREVQALNRMLQEHDDTLLRLASEAVFAGDAPTSFVQGLSDPSDYHLGTFTHADGTRYLMVVNRRCQPSRNLRTVTIDLDPSRLNGPGRPYLVRELYEKDAVVTNGAFPSVTASFAPGEGKLFRVEPWPEHVTHTPDVTNTAGVQHTHPHGGTVVFAPGDETGGGEDEMRSEVIVEGALDAGAGGVTFRSSDDADSSSGSWYGIRVAPTGHADLSGATIQGGLRCVEAWEASSLDVTGANLVDCGEGIARLPAAP